MSLPATPGPRAVSDVTIVGLNTGGSIPLSYSLRVDWVNAEVIAGVIVAMCDGATVNPAERPAAAESSGTVYFTLTHTAAGTGHTITTTLTVDGNGLASSSVDSITVQA